MTTIRIEDMRFYAHHGCFDEERIIGTHFRVDLSFCADTSKAQLSDNIDDTVNYLSVYRVVKHEMEQPSHLLEHVAERIGTAVLAEFDAVASLSVKVAKLNPPLGGEMAAVSVEIQKQR